MVLAQDLRKSVLRAAIQGLLTEQFENDSSVSELIEKIKDKKELLIKNKKINRDKPFSNIEKFKKYPFEIPANWRFERLGSLMINRDSERIPISSFDRKTRKNQSGLYFICWKIFRSCAQIKAGFRLRMIWQTRRYMALT